MRVDSPNNSSGAYLSQKLKAYSTNIPKNAAASIQENAIKMPTAAEENRLVPREIESLKTTVGDASKIEFPDTQSVIDARADVKANAIAQINMTALKQQNNPYTQQDGAKSIVDLML